MCNRSCSQSKLEQEQSSDLQVRVCACVFEVCSGSATVETVIVKEAMLFGVVCWCTDAPVALVSF